MSGFWLGVGLGLSASFAMLLAFAAFLLFQAAWMALFCHDDVALGFFRGEYQLKLVRTEDPEPAPAPPPEAPTPSFNTGRPSRPPEQHGPRHDEVPVGLRPATIKPDEPTSIRPPTKAKIEPRWTSLGGL